MSTDRGDLLVRDARVDGRLVDVLIGQGRIAAIDPSGGTEVTCGHEIDAAGGALLPGLHDHHVHLLALAAALGSVDVSRGDLESALAAEHTRAAPGTWLRVVGYDETISGPLDRHRLDALAPGRPVRVQHRSGAMWVLSSTALDRVLTNGTRGQALGAPPEGGVEHGADGEPTGRLFRMDAWVRSTLSDAGAPDLAAVGAALASRGITGVTDATPVEDPSSHALLATAAHGGLLPIHVAVMHAPALAAAEPPTPLRRGPVKVVLSDHALPRLDEVTSWFRGAHDAGRTVAVHCVTAEALELALAAWDGARSRTGDRVEHAAVVLPHQRDGLVRHGLRVVTQPAFVHASGDRYLATVDPVDLPHLYPCRSLLDAGIPVGGSSDAPFGPTDPWEAIGTAIDRRARSGAEIGSVERIDADRALALYLSPLEDPGGPPRRVEIGAPADLCLLDRPLPATVGDTRSVSVRATIVSGHVVHES
jgi:predicted amidohydrolase YtcJ